MALTWRAFDAEQRRNASVMTSCSLTSYAMMSVASLSAAAPGAMSPSWGALSVAVPCAARPPQLQACPSPTIAHPRRTWHSAFQGIAQPWVNRTSRAGQRRSAMTRAGVPVPVESALGDVLNDPVRHQVPDRHSVRDPLPAGGRGRREGRAPDQADADIRQHSAPQPLPAQGAADAMGGLEQFVRVLPGHQL